MGKFGCLILFLFLVIKLWRLENVDTLGQSSNDVRALIHLYCGNVDESVVIIKEKNEGYVLYED